MIYNILIVGAGQLGSRHLQSIKGTSLKTNIFVYDISIDSLRIAEKRYRQLVDEGNVEKIEFTTSLESVAINIDFAIVATGAKGRAEIIASILDACCIKYMLIEKVLFQNLQDYIRIQNLLKLKKVQAWVNCPRRMNMFYQELASTFYGQKISVVVEGYQWGLGCNTIHFIDLIAFLTGCREYVVTERLDKQIFESKRKGYIEFSGELYLKYRNGAQVRIISYANENGCPMNLTITSESCRILIDENKGEIFISKRENGWMWESKQFRLKYQSELTSEVLECLIKNSTCELTPYEESIKLHQPFIEAILAFLDRNYQAGIRNCPIT
ncbi:MAG: Gfo/Idh/MocA family oxidoreductase [Bacteroidales bacterium]|nr:Gfo/Idh/MocA family oxidoreductase [Bacteroidales bacterium]